MRILTVQQPWAGLIVSGFKDVENRNWPTKYRGWVLIHAGQTIDEEAEASLRERRMIGRALPMMCMPKGGVIGVAYLCDCVTKHPSKWFTGPYGLILTRRRVLRFEPTRGRTGLRRPPADLLRALIRQNGSIG